MSGHSTRKLFGYAKGILELNTGRTPSSEEMLTFLRAEAARINRGIESVSALDQRQTNRLEAVLRGFLSDLEGQAETDSPWASKAQRNYYRGLCKWAAWTDAGMDRFLKRQTGISSITFRIPKAEMSQCIEAAVAIISRGKGIGKKQVKQNYRASIADKKSAGGQG